MPKGAKALGPSSKANVLPASFKPIGSGTSASFSPAQLPSLAPGAEQAVTEDAAATVSALTEEIRAAYEQVVTAHQAAQASAMKIAAPLQAEVEGKRPFQNEFAALWHCFR